VDRTSGVIAIVANVATNGLHWQESSSPICFLARHAIGDWGELQLADVAENKHSLIHGFRLLSSYQTDAGEKLWIITEADRSANTLLLPEEY
jgi:hypothetical protein